MPGPSRFIFVSYALLFLLSLLYSSRARKDVLLLCHQFVCDFVSWFSHASFSSRYSSRQRSRVNQRV